MMSQSAVPSAIGNEPCSLHQSTKIRNDPIRERMNDDSLSTIIEKDEIFSDSDTLEFELSHSPSSVTSEERCSSPSTSSLSSSSSPTVTFRMQKGATEVGEDKKACNPDSKHSECFVLDPISIWENVDEETKMKHRTRTSMTHPGNVCPGVNELSEPHSRPIRHEKAKEALDFLFQRQRCILNQTPPIIDNCDQGAVPNDSVSEIIGNSFSSDYFRDGEELNRNVVIDFATNRSYVYTTDLEATFHLPEFLFLDVPNSVYAARCCGQYISNKLVMDLFSMAAQGGHCRDAILNQLVKRTNKSVYNVQNIYVPLRAEHSCGEQNFDMGCADFPVQAISTRFRLRYFEHGKHLHAMLRHNFMNGHLCKRGILVFIPMMERNSPADLFWGSLKGTRYVPDSYVTNSKMDKWCIDIAKHHGTYRGKNPEKIARSSSKTRKSIPSPPSKRNPMKESLRKDLVDKATNKSGIAKKASNPSGVPTMKRNLEAFNRGPRPTPT